MELNLIATGIELVGTTIKNLTVENTIVDVEKEAKRSFGLNINEPYFEKNEDGFFSQLTIDFEIEIDQSGEQKFKMELTLEGAFLSEGGIDEKNFKQLAGVNGAAAVIGIARGKIEAITSNIFNNGKITIPFVNVVDYYKSMTD
ncbi:MAG: hypothetical protein ACOX8F_00130 [Sakamotonia sp.]|jgi:preprotein translocase subunit SecB